MNFFKKLFGGEEVSAMDEQQEQQTRDFDVLKYDGVAALRHNQLEYAIKCFNHALEIQDDGETRDYLAQAYIQNNELPEAFAQLEVLSQREPDNLRIWLKMSDVAYLMEDYQAMANVCVKAREIDADDPVVNFSSARACIGLEDFDNAIALLTKAVEHPSEEKLWDAYLLRGQTNLRLEDVEAAEKDADHLLEQIGNNEDVLLLKARCCEKAGRNDEALQIFDKLIELNPFCLDAYQGRSALRMTLGDEEGSLDDKRVADELMANIESVTGDKTASEDIEKKVEESYRSVNPFA